jgi:flagellin-specific chaperone FliS
MSTRLEQERASYNYNKHYKNAIRTLVAKCKAKNELTGDSESAIRRMARKVYSINKVANIISGLQRAINAKKS